MCIRCRSFPELQRRPFHNFLPGSLRITQGHQITYRNVRRAACGWSQVHINSGPVALCGLLQWPIFIARQHTDPRYWYSNSVICDVPVLDENGLTYCHSFCLAMLCKHGQCRHAVCVCLSVCPSRSYILSKRINISSKFVHHRVATPV